MAEALGVVSGVLAIVTVALQLSKSTYETIASFRSQRQDIQDIQRDLTALTDVLGLIYKQCEESPENEHLRILQQPLSCCEAILRSINESLAECTQHAKDRRDSIRTWLKMRHHGKSFNESRERLSSYKATLCIAFGTINIQSQRTIQSSLDDIAKLIDRTREELEDQLNQTQEQISTTEGTLRATLEADRVQLQSCLKSLEELETSRGQRAQIAVTDNIATGANSRMLAGTDTAQPAFSLSVEHNRAEGGALMAAGVHSPETLKLFLQQSSASARVISLMEAMQTGRFDPRSAAAQELVRQSAAPPTDAFMASLRMIEDEPAPSGRILPARRELEENVLGQET